jgi:5-methylcytosine-specific restriction endonuclease McrA
MAGRTEARIFTSIWKDPGFLTLPPGAKLLWLSGRGIFRALEIDHVYPRSRGAADDAANYQVFCTSCNARKGAST